MRSIVIPAFAAALSAAVAAQSNAQELTGALRKIKDAKKRSNIKALTDLKGKTVVSTAGTTNMKWLTEENAKRSLGMSIVAVTDHVEALLMVDTGRAIAFFMDGIILYSLVANTKSPTDWESSSDAYTVEPLGIMLRRDDAAFKKVVDDTMVNLYKTGQINAIYEKWFRKPIPPKGVNLNVPLSAQFRKIVEADRFGRSS
jgi:glutamate/aspartate transport system substrate-binding protein